MHIFERWMTDHQVRWRLQNASTQEPGIQNKASCPWLLPRWAWQEGLWPPLRGDGASSLNAYLAARRVARHSGVHNLKSSWVSGVNLYFPFAAAHSGRSLLAGFLAAHVDARMRSVERLELEWAGEHELTPRTLLGEADGWRGSGQTSPDLAFTVNGGAGLLLVENKLTEHSFYSCSARTSTGSARRTGHPDPSRCTDVPALLDDPSRCRQQALGRQYWRWLHDAVDRQRFLRLGRCPAATAGYQLLRQQALAEALARSGRHEFVVSVVAVDARNERLARSLASTGLADVRDWAHLFRGLAPFTVVTHQEWVAWVRGHDPEGVWSEWSAWISDRYCL